MRYILIILLFTSVSIAQDLNIPKCKLKDNTSIFGKPIEWHNDKMTSTEMSLWTVGAVVGLTITDVLIYPEVQGTNLEIPYRMLQGALQLGISYVLAKTVGLSSAIGFNVMLLFGANDAGYYALRPSEFTGSFGHLPLNPNMLTNGGRLSKSDFKWGVGFSIWITHFLNVVKF